MGHIKLSLRLLLLGLPFIIFLFSCGGQSYDLVITNGTLVDGTGAEAYSADIAIRGSRIVKIGSLKKKQSH